MSALLNQLRSACRRGELSDIAWHFAELLGRLDPSAVPSVLLAGALVSERTVAGDVCMRLADEAGRRLLSDTAEDEIVAPALAEWRKALEHSESVGQPGESRPLILEPDGRLYLYRYWEWEKRLAGDLLARAALADFEVDDAVVARAVDMFFPVQPEAMWQRVAAALAILRPFTVITGGPGTGKTTTVVRVLALLQKLAGIEAQQIALAAPTGKAAARLREVLADAADLPGLEGVRFPTETTTEHRLLGIRATGGTPRRHANNPLTCKVLVVDEASMIDLGLMVKLVDAIPAHTRLILLGDRDQLASVEAGSVLDDICAGSEGLPADLAARICRLTGADPPAVKRTAPLCGSVAVLEQSWRYASDSGIGRLSKAVKAGDMGKVLECLEEPGSVDTALQSCTTLDELSRLLKVHALPHYSQNLRLAADGAPAGEVLDRFNNLRIVCAHRAGWAGVSGVNRLVELQLADAGLIQPGTIWYPGRPVMILANDYALGLFNGDVGVTLDDPDRPGQVAVYFPLPNGRFRAIWPGRLPPHETVFAMTVHKSQGSEFDRAILVLPDRRSPVLSRELLYTALSRAVSSVAIWGSREILAAAVSQRARRASGLHHRLSLPASVD